MMTKPFFYFTALLSILSAQTFAQDPKNESTTAPKGTLLTIDVSGKPGQNGLPGFSLNPNAKYTVSGSGFFYNSAVASALGVTGDVMALFSLGSASPGRDGRNGGPAGPSTVGENAGKISVNLTTGNGVGSFNGVMIVNAQIVQPSNASASNQYQIQYENQGYLYLYARGGKGGDGGHGGWGEAGQQGSAGRPATRHVWGGDGGTGGRGGDGGDGTSGSNGGKGGPIEVTVNEKDAALLMLVDTDVSGGIGGEVGTNGKGGSGGPGGPGGASAMGFETKYRTVTRYRTNSDGSSESYTEEESYQDPWFTPGGNTGSSGSSGRDANATLTAGNNGENGSVTYILQKQDGTSLSADKIYDLKLVDFKFDGMDGNGILEPGEIVTVNHVQIRNDGKLPTPAFQKTKIYIANHEWVLTDGTEIEIPQSLAPGESYEMPESFKFKIKDTSIETTGTRFVANETIQPLAHILEVNRHFKNFNLVKEFQITFPVEISEMTGLRSLAPGESTKLKFDVKNISTGDLGNLSEIKRVLNTTLRSMGGSLDLSKVVVTDASGKVLNLAENGTTQGLNVLKAGESVTIQATMKIDQSSEPFATQTLRNTLSLQHPVPERNNEIYPIQNQDHKVSVVQTFKLSSEPGILLITNSETSREEIDAWKKLGKNLDLSVDLWDASYYGRLPLLETQRASGKSLAEGYKNKLIVILDNDWENADANNRRALRNSDLLKKNEFIKTASVYGVNTLILGSENASEKMLSQYYFANEGLPSTFPNLKSFFDSFSEKNFTGRLLTSINEKFSEIEYGRWQFFGKPNVSALKNSSSRLLQKLSEAAPEEQYIVAYHIEPQMTKKALWGLFQKYRLGTIEVRRTLSNDLGLAASIAGREDAIHTAQFVNSDENLFSLFLTLPEEKRANFIVRAMTDDQFAARLIENKLSEPLIKATLAEIALKQSKVRGYADVTRKTISASITLMNAIQSKIKDARSLSENCKNFVAEFVAQTHYLASSQISWWHYLVPFSDQRQVSRFLRKSSYAILDALEYNKLDRKNIIEKIDLRRKALLKADVDAKTDNADAVLKRYLSPLRDQNYTFLESLRLSQASSIYEAKDIDSKLGEDLIRIQGIEEIEKLLKAERCSLGMEG